jgi:hypothetical protein
MKSKDQENRDREALRLAEETDVSPDQAKEMIDKHGKAAGKAEKEARNFKAEG